MKCIAVLQARTSSTRLPGKALLPICNIPMVVLAAKRAANKGMNVIVATSTEISDDGLIELVQSHGLSYYRGSLDNTLKRFVGALTEYHDDDLIFRLTADNVFPDGQLLDEMLKDFLARDLDYLCSNGITSGLPYGVSAELTKVGHLRVALKNCHSAFDKEHVTPYVIEKFGKTYFQKYADIKKELFRCTVDSFDDYIAVQRAFVGVVDPVHESVLSLINRLEGLSYQLITDEHVPKLVFGAAQIGSRYGIANLTGQPSAAQSNVLIKTAIANGVEYIDTARIYGVSENFIGQSLQGGWEGRVGIITKLSPLEDCSACADRIAVRALVDASVFESCAALRRKSLDILLVHRVNHISDWKGEVWNRLIELKSLGVINQLGASAQTPEDISIVIGNPNINHIQMPFNLLDWRWDKEIYKIKAAKLSRNLTIHVRSALLQGLLPSKNTAHWTRANVENPSEIQDWLRYQVEVCKRQNIVDLCIAYLNSLTWIDGIVIGMERMEQLIENITLFNSPPLTGVQVDTIVNTRKALSENTLNPALWKVEYK